jgi:predicted nucleic acid-binding protein
MLELVLDASVCLSWLFPDEENEWSNAVMRRLRNETQRLVVPAHWVVEVSNGLVVGSRRKRIKSEQIPLFWDALATLPVEMQPALTLTEAKGVVALSEKHSLTVYDATYLDLAQRRNIPLGTLDRELTRAATAAGVVLL